MVDEDVALAHRRHHVGLLAVLALQAGRGGAGEGRVAELAEARDVGDVEEVVEPEQARRRRRPGSSSIRSASTSCARRRSSMPALDLEPDHLAEAAAADLVLDRLKQVVGLVGDVVVGVAGDPEERVPDDLHAGEERGQVGGDHVLERDEGRPVAERQEAAAGAPSAPSPAPAPRCPGRGRGGRRRG